MKLSRKEWIFTWRELKLRGRECIFTWREYTAIYIYIYMYVYICLFIYVYVSMYIYVYIYIYLYFLSMCVQIFVMDPPRRPGAAGGTVEPWPGGSRGLPGPRPPRHLEWLPAAAPPAGAVAAAGGRSVVPTSPTTPPIGARCMPASCLRLANTVTRVVTEGEKGRGGRGRQSGRRETRAAGGCSATCVPRDQGTRGQQGGEGVGGIQMPRLLLRKVYAGGVKGGRGQGHRGPGTLGPGKGGKGGRGWTSTQGAGPGSGSREGEQGGGLLRELLRTVLALARGRR